MDSQGERRSQAAKYYAVLNLGGFYPAPRVATGRRAALINKFYEIDLLISAYCGDRMKVKSVGTERNVPARILKRNNIPMPLTLPTRP